MKTKSLKVQQRTHEALKELQHRYFSKAKKQISLSDVIDVLINNKKSMLM